MPRGPPCIVLGSPGPRAFEDKLAMLEPWARETLILCTEDPWARIEESIKWIAGRLQPDCVVSADIGGDGVLLGYERSLGSYTTDAVARAALALLAGEYGIPAYIAAGGIGAEGGGTELNPVELAATLETLVENGIVKGAWTPSPEHATIAKRLLDHAESGMLPLYIAAVEGRREARISMAYLHGTYEIKPWYKHILILDAGAHCELSPLCKAAKGRGIQGVTRWRSKQPGWYQDKLKRIRKTAPTPRDLDRIITSILDKTTRRPWTPSKCKH